MYFVCCANTREQNSGCSNENCKQGEVLVKVDAPVVSVTPSDLARLIPAC